MLFSEIYKGVKPVLDLEICSGGRLITTTNSKANF